MTDKEKIRAEIEKIQSSLNKIHTFIHSLHEETASDDLEEAAVQICQETLEGETVVIDGYEYVVRSDAEECFKAGAQWQKLQFEKNRLKHCDGITNEQAELESDFIDQHLDKYQRMPTFLDAIEYGRNLQKEQMMAKAVDATIEEPEPLLWRVLGELEGLFVVENNLHDGDGVKVIIIKED